MNKQTIRTLIVDDEPKSRNLNATILQKYCPRVNIVGLAESADQAYQLVLEHNPELLLLDIEMPHGSGFDLLKRINRNDLEVIFITGFDQYALQAIKFHALDFLLKPTDALQLIEAINKAEERIRGKRDNERLQQLLSNLNNADSSAHHLAIPTMDGREFVSINQIIYCTANGGYTSFTLSQGRQLLSSKNLGEYEKILPKSNSTHQLCFFRVHHRHLINLSYIKKYNSKENYIQLEGQVNISIAHRRKAKFLKILKEMNLH